MLIEDPDRLAAVRRSALIDSEREVVFDELTRAAAQVLDAPFAFMTAVDDTRSFWKSTYGVEDGTRQNAVEDSFCRYVIEAGGDDLIINDASADPLTCDNPSIESMGVRAWAGCAVVLDGQTLGTFCVVDDRVRHWTDDDREVLQRLATVASKEIEMRVQLEAARTELTTADHNAAHYSEILDTLRASLLPPALPEIPGLEISAWFEAASDGDFLLGDFYDVFPLANRRWGVVVGDVCGHGPKAARLTSLVRYTLRSAATHHDDPADVLAELDRAILRDGTNAGRFATLVFLVVDPTQSPVAVTYARAGHPHPIVKRSSGQTELVNDASGRPVGIGSMANDHTTGQLHLDANDTLVLYTDGATEARCPATGAMFGTDRLRDVLTAMPVGTASDTIEALRLEFEKFTPKRDDDVVVLALSFQPENLTPTTHSG